LVFEYQSFNLAQLVSRDASISGKRYRGKPELAFSLTAAHMDMSGLCAFIRVEVEAEALDPQNSWHFASSLGIAPSR
jgi:hypothetical protein